VQKSLFNWFVELMQRDYPEDWARLCQHAHAAYAPAAIEPSVWPELDARWLLSHHRRGVLDHLLPSETRRVCRECIQLFADAFRNQMVGRIKGTPEIKPLDPALISVETLRFEPDELVLDEGELIIVDVRVEPAPGGQHEADAPVETTGADRRTGKSPQRKKPPAPPPSPPAAATAESQSPKRRRNWQRDVIRAAIKDKWGPGWPPDILSTPDALRQLDHELDRLKIKASDDTKKRAMGRRD
jgi:hypothetical protein